MDWMCCIDFQREHGVFFGNSWFRAWHGIAAMHLTFDLIPLYKYNPYHLSILVFFADVDEYVSPFQASMKFKVIAVASPPRSPHSSNSIGQVVLNNQ